MPDAYIFDHVRTPRGKGKKDGSLHEVTPIRLATQMLEAIRDRNKGLDTREVEDVILGCVTPVGEQGTNIARTAVMMAGYDESVPGVQINRFCASGLEAVNMAAAKVMSGQSPMAIGGGVESMSRVPMASDGGAWPVDPAVAMPTYFVPQGISADLIATKYGISRNDADAYAVEKSQAGRQSLAGRPLREFRRARERHSRHSPALLRRDDPRRRHHAVAGRAQPILRGHGQELWL